MFAASKTASVSGGYQISRSLRFNSADTPYLNRTPASATNRKTWTWSGWLKRSALGSFSYFFGASPDSFNNTFLLVSFGSSDNLRIQDYQSGFTCNVQTTAVYRDVSAWYHVVFAVDTTQATASNRVRLYVNGVEVTAFSTATYPTQNTDLTVDNNVLHVIGYTNTTNNFNGYMTEVNFIDGQALTPSSFGETNAQTGVWQPKAYSGSYGTNGFYLNFSDNSNTTAATLGKDYSGNGNNWTPNNFSVTAGVGNDSMVDSPTAYGADTGAGGTVRGNYATLNPLNAFGTSTFTNGNLDVSVSSLNTNNLATIAIPTSGKWYWEYQITSIGGGGSPMGGIASTSSNSPALFYRSNGDKLSDGTSSSYGATYTTTDIIGVAVDVNGGTITFYKNGSSQGAITYATSSGSFFPALRSNAATDNFTVNFGQRAFANTAPSGFQALCTQNLPTPTIGATTATQAGKYFNPVLYTGTGSSLGVTGVGFQPDWTWIKSRSGPANHGLYDAVRGVQKQIMSNSTSAETTETTGLTAFGSDGFTTGALAQINTSATTYVAWNWKANGAGSSNTAGSITSTASANTTSGFSVVTYTGNGSAATIGHGLGVAPSMYIVKNRTGSADEWVIYHANLTSAAYYLTFQTNAQASNNVVFNSTAPTSTVFSVGTSRSTNTVNFVAYAFAPIAGYSAFGSFVGNGSADGPFVFTGMRPAFVMIKKINATGDWLMTDATRNQYNAVSNELVANVTSAEGSGFNFFDYLSNGFKARGTNASWNNSGDIYIYAAFAQNPFKTSLAR